MQQLIIYATIIYMQQLYNYRYGSCYFDKIGQKPVNNFNIYQKLNRKCHTCQPRDWS